MGNLQARRNKMTKRWQAFTLNNDVDSFSDGGSDADVGTCDSEA